MTLAIGKFLENPVGLDGDPSAEDKRVILDCIKGAVSKQLTCFCGLQLREKAQPDWQVAYAFRGTGSTFDRRQKIESLYERWVPEPVNEADDMRHINDFVDTLKRAVVTAIDETRKAMDAEASFGSEMAAE